MVTAEGLTDVEKNTICEISNISIGAAATALSTLIGRRVDVAIPEVHITTRNVLKIDYPLPCILSRIKYAEGFVGENILVIKKRDAVVIVDLIMGGNGINPSEEFNEIHLSALAEAMNQMMGSAAKSLSFMLDQKVFISTPELSLIDLTTEDLDPSIEFGSVQLAQVVVKLFIEEVLDSEIMQLMPLMFAKEMACSFINELNLK